MTEVLWLLLLVCAAAGASFYAGWRSAASYLEAARAVSEITSALDKAVAESASLREAIRRSTEALDAGQRRIEESLVLLFQGFEQSGFVRRPGVARGRQVGETAQE